MEKVVLLAIEAPRIEVRLSCISGAHPDIGSYVAIARLHMPSGETLQWTLQREGSGQHIDRDTAAKLLADIFAEICNRFGAPGQTVD